MATIKKDYNSMGLPMNIQRSNPIPLDKTEIYYSLSDAEAYAKSATAYVGQTIKVVDESTGRITWYIIGRDSALIDKDAEVEAKIGDQAGFVLLEKKLLELDWSTLNGSVNLDTCFKANSLLESNVTLSSTTDESGNVLTLSGSATNGKNISYELGELTIENIPQGYCKVKINQVNPTEHFILYTYPVTHALALDGSALLELKQQTDDSSTTEKIFYIENTDDSPVSIIFVLTPDASSCDYNIEIEFRPIEVTLSSNQIGYDRESKEFSVVPVGQSTCLWKDAQKISLDLTSAYLALSADKIEEAIANVDSYTPLD